MGDIERLRREMCESAKGKPLADPEVVAISQELDKLLVEYHYMKEDFKYFNH